MHAIRLESYLNFVEIRFETATNRFSAMQGMAEYQNCRGSALLFPMEHNAE